MKVQLEITDLRALLMSAADTALRMPGDVLNDEQVQDDLIAQIDGLLRSYLRSGSPLNIEGAGE